MIVLRTTALAAAVSLAACVVPLREQVPPAQAALRLPPNRAGVMVGDDLVRVTWLPGAGELLVASRADGGKAVLTYLGALRKYRGGLLADKPAATPALARARAASAFHAPVEADAAGSRVWLVHDVVPRIVDGRGEHALTLEAYAQDPRPAWRSGKLVAPDRIWIIGRRGPDGAEAFVDTKERASMLWRGAFLRPTRLDRASDGHLTGATFERWIPRVEPILAGQTAEGFLGAEEAGEALAMERNLNDTLVEWKTRRLVDWARGAPVEQLEDVIVKAEKGMLELDRRGRVLKDEIDAAARAGGAAQPALTERAQLLDQRRMLVGTVVTTLKQARSAARAAPASVPAR